MSEGTGLHYRGIIMDDLVDHETHLASHSGVIEWLIKSCEENPNLIFASTPYFVKKEKKMMRKFIDTVEWKSVKGLVRRLVFRLIARFLDFHLEQWLDQQGGYVSQGWAGEVDRKVDALTEALGYRFEYKIPQDGKMVAVKIARPAKKKAKGKKR